MLHGKQRSVLIIQVHGIEFLLVLNLLKKGALCSGLIRYAAVLTSLDCFYF